MNFMDLPASRQLHLLFGGQDVRRLDSKSDLLIAEGLVSGRAVTAVFTDSKAKLGTLGCRECDALEAAALRASKGGHVMVLGLDSAGTRLSEGIEALGAIRKAFRSLCDIKAGGGAVVALVGKHAFGSASMLAYAADVRVFERSSAFAMTGPKALVAGAPQGVTLAQASYAVIDSRRYEFNRADAVNWGGVDDYLALARSAVLRAADGASTGDFYCRKLLHDRLQGYRPGSGVSDDDISVRRVGNVLRITVNAPSGLTPTHCLRLISCLDAAHDHAGTVAELRVRCPSHSFDLRDEAVAQSQYLVQLAAVMRKLVHAGLPIEVVFESTVSGGAYIALAAGASAVHVAPGASIVPLPAQVMQTVLSRESGVPVQGVDEFKAYFGFGLVDGTISNRETMELEQPSCEEM
ncbi:hypothetical protein H5407_10705 [Mitsuaria sp. WAJ17]|uniref:hypothetical protein n=1 Tax=Mitsuaria sp. WAJ17 TaxID=2761452 RepID=UPI0015FF7C85|nr:hypothetical protein [Mitsuaria sp. WAJ17]MBB2485688.1 hypothetical protein [Mitsuaria sp. WAJ17]